MAFAASNLPLARSSATRFGRACRSARVGLAICFATLLLVAALSGCGGAHAPCPTRTSDLDRHREESFAAEEDLRGALADERAIRAEREASAARIEAASVALDSLKTAAGTK